MQHFEYANVELIGILVRRSCFLAKAGNRQPFLLANSCGADRDRTDDLLVANEALSQLSYSPKFSKS